MVDINDPRVKQNINKIKELLNKKEIQVCFIPSVWLKDIIAKGEHPFVKDIPNNRKTELLSGGGVIIQKQMVYNWIENKLDKKNSFILSNGDIRVIDPNLILLSDGTKKE
jgi:hypothetical protein